MTTDKFPNWITAAEALAMDVNELSERDQLKRAAVLKAARNPACVSYDAEAQALILDEDGFLRLNEGTPFQQSTNALAMLHTLHQQMMLNALKEKGVPKKAWKKYLRQQHKRTQAWVKANPLAGMDSMAVELFCNH